LEGLRSSRRAQQVLDRHWRHGGSSIGAGRYGTSKGRRRCSQVRQLLLFLFLWLWFRLWRRRCRFPSLSRNVFPRLLRRLRRRILFLFRRSSQSQPVQCARCFFRFVLRWLCRALFCCLGLFPSLFRKFRKFTRAAEQLGRRTTGLGRHKFSFDVARDVAPRHVGEPSSSRR
jgi:hypothetical protein